MFLNEMSTISLSI